jgi:hypothetical protein
MDTAVLDKPKEKSYEPKPATKTGGGFGNKKPPKRPVSYAKNPDDEPSNDEPTSWEALGLQDPFA